MADQKGNQFIGGYSGLTHADVSGYIGRTLTVGEQTLVTSLISYAELFFAKATNRNYKTSQNYYDVFDAGVSNYVPSNFPVNEVEKIELDGVAEYTKGVTSDLVLNTDFFVYDDWIKFAVAPNSTEDNRQALKITYTIGSIFNADAKFALLMWVANYFLNRETGGKDLTSQNAGGISLSFTSNVPDYITRVINSYRKYNI